MALNVLVVDDSAVMRRMVIKILGLSGLPLGEIHEAADGRQGLQKLKENWIDLVLADINMPVMNGEEMIRQMRQNPETRDVQVIVVSTESSQARIDMLQEEQGTGFVHKPFTPELLREQIVGLTGVTDELQSGDGIIQDSGPDF
jgi:two-component system chemotaxis response regulator CheY